MAPLDMFNDILNRFVIQCFRRMTIFDLPLTDFAEVGGDGGRGQCDEAVCADGAERLAASLAVVSDFTVIARTSRQAPAIRAVG